MPLHEQVELLPEEFAYKSLSHQNLPFHSAIAELIDNSISKSKAPWNIEIWVDKLENGKIRIIVADEGTGMSLEILKKNAFKLGGKGPSTSRLNEHGFGLKNALCALTRNEYGFRVLTRDEQAIKDNMVYKVDGPFRQGMVVEEGDISEFKQWRMDVGKSKETGTIIFVICDLPTLQTVASGVPGPKPTILERNAEYLAEHLGVLYRGFLKYDYSLGYPRGRVIIRCKDNGDWTSKPVVPIEPPYAERREHRFNIIIDGRAQEIDYIEGVRDEVKATMHIYYRGNIPTQGVDIQINDRVVATHWFTEIWNVVRHGSFNDFIGEIIIRCDDPNRFRTLFNKTAFEETDPWWLKLKEYIQGNYEPQICQRGKRELLS